MKKIIILIASCLSAVAATKAETEIEKKVKQVILDNNAYALKNLKNILDSLSTMLFAMIYPL